MQSIILPNKWSATHMDKYGNSVTSPIYIYAKSKDSAKLNARPLLLVICRSLKRTFVSINIEPMTSADCNSRLF